MQKSVRSCASLWGYTTTPCEAFAACGFASWDLNNYTNVSYFFQIFTALSESSGAEVPRGEAASGSNPR